MLASLTESMFTDRQTDGGETDGRTDNRQQGIRKANYRKSSGGLETHFYYYIRGMIIFRKN